MARYPSARWAYTLPVGVQWTAGNMTAQQVLVWYAQRADLFTAFGTPPYHADTIAILQANPNLQIHYYQEWYYINAYMVHHTQEQHHTEARYVGSRVDLLEEKVPLENLYILLEQDADYPKLLTKRFREEAIDYLWFEDPTPRFGKGFRIVAYSMSNPDGTIYPTLLAQNGYAFGVGNRQKFDTLFFEFIQPASGLQFVLEYSAGYTLQTTPSAAGLTHLRVPAQWKQLEILQDTTNGFTQDGYIQFKVPEDWTRASVVDISPPEWDQPRSCYLVRIRAINTPTTAPKAKGIWCSTPYQWFHTLASNGQYAMLGFKTQTNQVNITVRIAGAGTYSLTWQYYGANGWTTLTVTDGTNSLKQSGTVSWTIPADWTVTGSSAGYQSMQPFRYWVKVIINGTPTTPPQFYAPDLNHRDTDGNSFTLRCPGLNGTAKWKEQAKLPMPAWQGRYAFWLRWRDDNVLKYYNDFYRDIAIGKDGALVGIYSDSTEPNDFPPLVETDTLAWKQRWLSSATCVRYLGVPTIGNIGSWEPHAPMDYQKTRFPVDKRLHSRTYHDIILREHYPQSKYVLTNAIRMGHTMLNCALAAGEGQRQIYMFNPDQVWSLIGNGDWERYLQHCTAFYMLIQFPDADWMSIRDSANEYNVIPKYDDPTISKPAGMFYLPQALLEVDIGVPANWIPTGYEPAPLEYLSSSNATPIKVADTRDKYCNYAVDWLAERPLRPTYVFILAKGTGYKVYARAYTDGLVVLKLPEVVDSSTTGDASATTHTLPGTYRRVLDDGTLAPASNQVTLRGMEGAILVGYADEQLQSASIIKRIGSVVDSAKDILFAGSGTVLDSEGVILGRSTVDDYVRLRVHDTECPPLPQPSSPKDSGVADLAEPNRFLHTGSHLGEDKWTFAPDAASAGYWSIQPSYPAYSGDFELRVDILWDDSYLPRLPSGAVAADFDWWTFTIAGGGIAFGGLGSQSNGQPWILQVYSVVNNARTTLIGYITGGVQTSFTIRRVGTALSVAYGTQIATVGSATGQVQWIMQRQTDPNATENIAGFSVLRIVTLSGKPSSTLVASPVLNLGVPRKVFPLCKRGTTIFVPEWRASLTAFGATDTLPNWRTGVPDTEYQYIQMRTTIQNESELLEYFALDAAPEPVRVLTTESLKVVEYLAGNQEKRGTDYQQSIDLGEDDDETRRTSFSIAWTRFKD